MAMGEPDHRDRLFDFSFPPEEIAGRCRLDMQAQREEYMPQSFEKL